MADIIMGIDVGYSHTKVVTAKGKDIFRSTIREGVIDLNPHAIVIEYDGQKMTIGERGTITINEDKIDDPVFEPLLMTAILRNADERLTNYSINLVTGLPIAWYPKQKDRLRDFLQNKHITIGYKGKDRNIHIKDCLIFPQSAGLALTNPRDFEDGRTNLVIDIGGLTVDVSYYEGRRLVKYDSWQLGMLKFYDKLRTAINGEFNVEVDDQDVERFIEEGQVTYKQKQHKFDFEKHFKQHMNEVVTKVKTSFPWDIVHNISFVGGGSLRFQDYIPVNDGIECDQIQSNAEAFYNVGVQKFG